MFSKVQQIIEDRLKDNWVSTPVAYDNVEYVPKAGVPFIRPTITQTLSELTTVASPGKGNYREYGILTVQVFTEQNKGSRPNATLADGVAALFRGYNEERLYMHEARINRIGSDKEFFQTNVLVEFYYDNCLNA